MGFALYSKLAQIIPAFVCSSCPSDRDFAYSFLQIPPHDGHPCCSAIHFPLSGRVRDLHPLERAHGAQTKKKNSPQADCSDCRQSSIGVNTPTPLFSVYSYNSIFSKIVGVFLSLFPPFFVSFLPVSLNSYTQR